MRYKDTLSLYDELVAGGCTEAQARVQASQLGGVGEFLDEFKQDFNMQMIGLKEEMGDIKKDLHWMRLIGATMIVTFLGNIILMKM